MIMHCAACRGRKVMKTMGGMTGECMACKGVGYVSDVVSVPSVEPFVPSSVVVKIDNEYKKIKKSSKK